jgi:hypothetical protein
MIASSEAATPSIFNFQPMHGIRQAATGRMLVVAA